MRWDRRRPSLNWVGKGLVSEGDEDVDVTWLVEGSSVGAEVEAVKMSACVKRFFFERNPGARVGVDGELEESSEEAKVESGAVC